jgi:hypothetical protein
MSIRYPQEISIESQTKKAQERIVSYQFQLDTVKRFFIVLERFEGKKITKHIINAIKKEYPDLFDWIYLDDTCGMYHIKAKKGNESIRALIGYATEGRYSCPNVVNMANIKEFNKCYTLNEERIEKLNKGIFNIPLMVKTRQEIIDKWKKLETLAEESEMTYDFDFEK